MRVWDCHVHLGNDSGEDVLRAMDAAGIERINLFSRYPYDSDGVASSYDRAATREAADHLAQVQAADPERIYGLLWAEPRVPGIEEEIEYALVDRGLRGIKLIPNHWYPGDELLMPIYEKMQALGKPIQFHCGILYGFGDSSRFCRPVMYEPLLHFPNLRFSLAHIGWPWVDECLAVYGNFRSVAGRRGLPQRLWVDTCRGTPDAWRLEALSKALPFVDGSHLMFGSDGSPSNLGRYGAEHIGKDLVILRDVIGVSEGQIKQFFWGACEAFWHS